MLAVARARRVIAAAASGPTLHGGLEPLGFPVSPNGVIQLTHQSVLCRAFLCWSAL